MTDDTKPYRVLSLDGGGAKGFYTLGVLKEVEALVGEPLHQRFDLIYGTSTGAIIAALLCLGKSADEILALYKEHVVKIMAHKSKHKKSAALAGLAAEVFGDAKFDAVKTKIGIVTARWIEERPMIFKGDVAQAFGRQGSFVPGFGATIGDAVAASCSAYPFFNRRMVQTSQGLVELVDGGYCANNPTLYAINDAIGSLGQGRSRIRVLSVGVGEYPTPTKAPWRLSYWKERFWLVRLLQKTFEFNTRSMEQMRCIMFKDVQTERINDAFKQPEMATDMFEHDLGKLDILWQRGRQSFAAREEQLKKLLL